MLAAGDYRYKGADLGILVSRGRMQTEENELTDSCRDWIAGIRSQFKGTPVEEDADGRRLETLRSVGYPDRARQSWRQIALEAPLPAECEALLGQLRKTR